MKVIGWFVMASVLVVVLFFAGSHLIPDPLEVERSTLINVSSSVVHEAVVDLEVWQQWEPWGRADESLTVTYGELRRGEGASYRWDGRRTGTGLVEILDVSPEEVRFRYVFNENTEQPAYASIRMEAVEAEVTAVTWTFRGARSSDAIQRYLTVLIRPMVEESYEEGLRSLKVLLEASERPTPTLD